jgi:hypothetical protein
VTWGPQPLPHEGRTRPVGIVRDILAGPASGRLVLAISFTGASAIAPLVAQIAPPRHIADMARDG